MRNCYSLLIPLLGLLLSQSTLAEIYKTVDKDGNVVYTDQAPHGDKKTEKVKLKPSNSVPAIQTPAIKLSPEDPDKPFKYKTLRIVSPENDGAIEHGPGNFSVTAKILPQLRNSDRIQLFIDGKPHGKPGKSTSWALKNVFRGTHMLQVKVLSLNGKTLKKSKKSSVHVFRPSVAHPGNRG
ncbi:MAG: DUF4124 domain-containing protein [Pseudomonadales bacterium]